MIKSRSTKMFVMQLGKIVYKWNVPSYVRYFSNAERTEGYCIYV